jgi:N-acetylmuramoyl-L-alanine amidase
MKPLVALAISVALLGAQDDRATIRSVTAVRTWSMADVTRIAVEISGDFTFRTDRLHNPERVYFDLVKARPRIDAKRLWSKDINDKLVQRVRVAETHPGTTRVVLDLAGPVEVTTSQLSNPNRLMVELRPGVSPPIPTEPLAPALKPPVSIRAEVPKVVTPAVAASEELSPAPPPLKPDQGTARVIPPASKSKPPASPAAPKSTPVRTPPEPVAAATETVTAGAGNPIEAPAPVAIPTSPLPGEFGRAAKRTSTGGNSLTRALGLKIGRIVIDAGHGGHDQGTQSPHGLLEKELVLDVALRVGKLVEEKLNAEVIYTRSDDTFIPLEGRTVIANQRKADLFLSIHANSSPIPKISGVETYYLNFSDSKDALDVASRENASSQKSIFELQDIIHKITLHEKLDESREFAARIQSSLYAFSSRNVVGQKNRGVKKAPFVVLIGASMPSVLAEIGFLSNAREEALLKKPDYRQKLAESLFRGIAKYAEGLSHFQLAAN